ncbi:hypothetical protein WJX72_000397 [[Myrmecia] bisecta]
MEVWCKETGLTQETLVSGLGCLGEVKNDLDAQFLANAMFSPDIAKQLDNLLSKQVEMWCKEAGLSQETYVNGLGEVKTDLDFLQWQARRVINGGHIRLYLRLDGKDVSRTLVPRKMLFDMGADGAKTYLQETFEQVGKGELMVSELEPPSELLSEMLDGEWEIHRNLAEAVVLVVDSPANGPHPRLQASVALTWTRSSKMPALGSFLTFSGPSKTPLRNVAVCGASLRAAQNTTGSAVVINQHACATFDKLLRDDLGRALSFCITLPSTFLASGTTSCCLIPFVSGAGQGGMSSALGKKVKETYAKVHATAPPAPGPSTVQRQTAPTTQSRTTRWTIRPVITKSTTRPTTTTDTRASSQATPRRRMRLNEVHGNLSMYPACTARMH